MLNVKTIVENYLKENGYDGLACEECGCDIEDLFPCNSECALDCKPAYKVECNGTYEYHFITNKESNEND